jgi:hypothetical protein
MYMQKLFRNSTVVDAISQAMHSVPDRKIFFIQAEVQTNLFHDHEDVFVTLEINDAPCKK